MFSKNFKLALTFTLLGLFVVVLSLSVWWLIEQTTAKSTGTNSGIANTICWNRVIIMDNQYYWPNGCRGNPRTESMLCTTVLVELSPEEQSNYLEWLNTKPTLDPKCYD